MSLASVIPPVRIAAERRWLESLVRRYHHRRFLAPDPLEFLYDYDASGDREVVGLVAASLAYGNVQAMRPAIADVLRALGPTPAVTLANADGRRWTRALRGFRYRFTTGRQLAGLLAATGRLLRDHGSVEGAVEADVSRVDTSHTLATLADALQSRTKVALDHLVPHPARGSACKRMNLYLRWMVRSDAIDPGGWTTLRPAQLIIPLDTHVFQAASRRGWITRRTANLRTAREITAVLRAVRPDDPLRYDFALTRPGIRGEDHIQ